MKEELKNLLEKLTRFWFEYIRLGDQWIFHNLKSCNIISNNITLKQFKGRMLLQLLKNDEEVFLGYLTICCLDKISGHVGAPISLIIPCSQNILVPVKGYIKRCIELFRGIMGNVIKAEKSVENFQVEYLEYLENWQDDGIESANKMIKSLCKRICLRSLEKKLPLYLAGRILQYTVFLERNDYRLINESSFDKLENAIYIDRHVKRFLESSSTLKLCRKIDSKKGLLRTLIGWAKQLNLNPIYLRTSIHLTGWFKDKLKRRNMFNKLLNCIGLNEKEKELLCKLIGNRA